MHRTSETSFAMVILAITVIAAFSPSALAESSLSSDPTGEVLDQTGIFQPGFRTLADDPNDNPGPYTNTSTEVSFDSSVYGGTINGRLYYPREVSGVPGIVFGVGFHQAVISGVEDISTVNLMSYNEYSWMAEPLASWGYAVLVIGFRGPFDAGHTLWIEEMREAVDSLVDGTLAGAETDVGVLVDEYRMAVMGHNVGGAVAIAEASTDRRVKAVIGLAPWDGLGNNMLQDIGYISPVPVQIQSGPANDPVENWGIAGQDIYDEANSPRQLINIGYTIGGATYEGFTDYGIVDIWGTRQQDMSRYYAFSFLNYYLADEADYIELLINDYVKDKFVANDGLYYSKSTTDGLDAIIRDVEVSNVPLDVSLGAPLYVSAQITPRGVGWGSSEISVQLEFQDSTVPIFDSKTESFPGDPLQPIHNSDRDNRSAGDYRVQIAVTPDHTLGKNVFVTVSVTNSHGEIPVLADGSPAGTSESVSFKLEAHSSDSPSFTMEVINPGVDLVEDNEIRVTVNATDDDGIGWYQTKVDDFVSDWKSAPDDSFTASATVSEAGSHKIEIRVKDREGVESDWKSEPFTASRPPVAEPFGFEDNVKEDTKVEFDVSDSYDPDNDSIEYNMDFGDGSSSGWTSTSVIKHTYTRAGDFTVRLTVRDEYNLTDTHDDYITIKEKEDSIAESGLSGGMTLPVIGIIGAIAVIGAFYYLSTRKEVPGDSGDAIPIPGEPSFNGDPGLPGAAVDSPAKPLPPPPSGMAAAPITQSTTGAKTLPPPPPSGAKPLPPPPSKSKTLPPSLPSFPAPPSTISSISDEEDDEIIMPKMDADIIYPKGYTPPADTDEKTVPVDPTPAKGDPGKPEEPRKPEEPPADSSSAPDDDDIVYPKGMKPEKSGKPE